MSNSTDEQPTFFGYTAAGGRQKITDELPTFIGKPMKFIAFIMRLIVTFSGFIHGVHLWRGRRDQIRLWGRSFRLRRMAFGLQHRRLFCWCRSGLLA